jgi:adenosylmethionine-8-amino-7-oxononanoate aminotransferase
MTNYSNILENDQRYVWHPYSAMNSDQAVFAVESAQGVYIKLADGRILVDGMSSWWSAIHGYNQPEINQAICDQLQNMSHIMFGGLTHQPAVELATQLIQVTPNSLQTVFFVDSGSVSVEVAMKMAIQYWFAKQQADKNKFLALRQGYHGDTFAAMSVSDPINGMHTLFVDSLIPQFFADAPTCQFNQPCSEADIASVALQLEKNHLHIAAVILEPIVQGAGGMNFYSPQYLQQVRQLCDQYQVLLIADEIATGFGRTGKLFACEYADIEPDILCLGKALTGGYMTLAATLTTTEIAQTISNGEPGLFMHGPTFMANPLACSAALASLKILLDSPWQQRIKKIEKQLTLELSACQPLKQVKDVRVLGAIGVVELHHAVDLTTLQTQFVNAGVWVRPFNRLIYLMPPYIIEAHELSILTRAITTIISTLP